MVFSLGITVESPPLLLIQLLKVTREFLKVGASHCHDQKTIDAGKKMNFFLSSVGCAQFLPYGRNLSNTVCLS